jgi:outer membrane lipoprotein-sorting protein
MRRLSLIAAAVAVMAPPAAAQTVDELVAKNLQARGGLEKLKGVQSLRMTGKITMGPGMEAPVVLELKRGNQMRVEFTFQGMTGVQAFDGKTGWAVMPFAGSQDPVPMPPEAVKDAEEQADIDGPLVDYKAKGTTIELLGKEPVDGQDAYKLKVTLKNGNVRTIWLDAARSLEVKGESTRTMQGTQVESETMLSNYKDVSGILFPHQVEGGPKGVPQRQKIVLDTIEVNPTLDDARFRMPVKKEEPKTPEKPKS